MERRWRAGSTGYVVVLIGVVAFVVGCFLPYYEYAQSPLGSVSLYRLMMFPPSGAEADVGAFLFLFAGIATLAWVAIAGVRGSESWTRSALAAVTIAWSLTWIGTLLGAFQFATRRLLGYWVLFLGVGVVVIGAIMVWVSGRADVVEIEAPPAERGREPRDA
jgi:hypothetical protein